MVVAFAFARLRSWACDTMFIVMLATMMLAPHVTLIPQLILFKNLPEDGCQAPLFRLSRNVLKQSLTASPVP